MELPAGRSEVPGAATCSVSAPPRGMGAQEWRLARRVVHSSRGLSLGLAAANRREDKIDETPADRLIGPEFPVVPFHER